MASKLFAILLILYATSFCLADDLPPFIHVCHRNDPNLEQCLISAVEDIRPYLVKGVPEYNIPSIEPLIMKDLISEEAGGMKIVTSNVSAYGCSDFFVRSITTDIDTVTFTINVDIPKLRIEAHYHLDGKILLLPVKGDGQLETNVTECVTTTILKGEVYDKDGIKHIKFISNDLKVKFNGGHVRLENIFNNDKILLGMINDVVNKNLDAFLKELMPPIEKALAVIFLEIANDIVQPFSFDQLFPQ